MLIHVHWHLLSSNPRSTHQRVKPESVAYVRVSSLTCRLERNSSDKSSCGYLHLLNGMAAEAFEHQAVPASLLTIQNMGVSSRALLIVQGLNHQSTPSTQPSRYTSFFLQHECRLASCCRNRTRYPHHQLDDIGHHSQSHGTRGIHFNAIIDRYW